MANSAHPAKGDPVDIDGAIAERPREIRQYPLLNAVYARHDQLINEWARGRTLEIAHGQYAHPTADVAVDIFAENAHAAQCAAAVSDARQLPFTSDSFEMVIGRRFLHYVPAEDRLQLIEECKRVFKPGG
ncbi:class I SAM-dependent methyltransferase [Haloarcula nitratireducens]|uniref:class I SAM-dependent methyltransferase n=1 Tax=Haloarcula nitratireducens TaxID=2487749 RepID=UPI001F1F206C|nr:class I SAM-dependent methyltransferase [Halomicroarcula nitratireducens]